MFLLLVGTGTLLSLIGAPTLNEVANHTPTLAATSSTGQTTLPSMAGALTVQTYPFVPFMEFSQS